VALSLCFKENEKVTTISLREIMLKDFSGKNLRGRNFKGQDLTGAKFIGADIRGANFTNALLREADFTRAKAGLQGYWTIFIVTVSLFLSVISGFMSGFASSWIAVFLILNIVKQYTIISAVLMPIVLAIFFIDTIRQGLRAVAVAVAVAGAVAGAATIAAVMAGAAAATGAVAGAAAATGAVAGAAATGVGAIAGTGTATIAGAVTGLGMYLAGRALAGEEKYAWIHTTAIAITTIGGTSFRNADLTDANFTEATLKSTDFRTANLNRTCFRNTEKLDRARVGNSILADTRVRELLITGNGYKKSYVGANFQGANLTGVNLNKANLKQANLSEASLHQANLEGANLTETQALATDFTEAYFTGACLEAWNIDANTKLDRVDCRFVYLLEYPKPGTDDRDRRPHHISKCFEPGDFEKLYKKIITTVQIMLKDGINPVAFTAAFYNLMQEFPDITGNSLQGIEKKENDVLLTLNIPEGADNGKLEQIWAEVYQARLEAQRQAEQLKYKDEEIAFYRQEIADMKEIVDILAQQPQSINIIQEDK
jgi:uncharacterized protein YjbI with pentapeptide repeats